jgi:hypothetical protein
MHASASAPSTGTVADVEREARETVRSASPWIEGLGRFGFAAKGVVYLVVGTLAVDTALGRGGATTDQQGALARIAEAPFGRALLVVVAVGLVGYALWRIVQGVLNTDRKESDAKGWLARALTVGVGIVYAGLAYSAMRIAIGAGGTQGSTQRAQDWTAWLMGQPLGAWIVGAVGIAIIGNGLVQARRAIGDRICESLDCSSLGAEQRTWIERLGRIGYAARGVAFFTIGSLLILAAVHRNPSEAKGLDGALATLASQPFGPHLLGLVAAGLAAYGLFALVEARYRRMVVCDEEAPTPGPSPLRGSGETAGGGFAEAASSPRR